MPAYIVISELQGLMPVLGALVAGAQLATIKRQRSAPAELEAAVETLLARIAAARHPVAIVTSLVARYGVREQAMELIRRANLPVAVMPNDKGTVDESLPNFLGLYAGGMSSSPAVAEAVTQADLVLDIGGLVLTELNTGLWTDLPAAAGIVSIQDDWVRAGEKVFVNVAIGDVLAALVARVQPRTAAAAAGSAQPAALTGQGGDQLTSAQLYPRIQRRLRTGDTVVVETGTCMLHLNRMRLPAGVGVEGQGLWGSIGWATPACLGIALAKTSGRTWLVTGDGSHQLTLNELAVMGRYGVKPVIFVLNNGLYGIEDVISERGHAYDDLAAVRYHLLPEAFGCKGWLTAKVQSVAEFDAVLDRIEAHDGAAYIELVIPNEESQPLPAAVIDSGYKLRTPPAG
jgi:indolepyruvate decarboxylase